MVRKIELLILRKIGVSLISVLMVSCGPAPTNSTNQISSDGSSNSTGLQVLGSHCSSCHGMFVGGAGGVSNIMNVEHLISSGLAIPGSPQSSAIYQSVAMGRMPPAGRIPSGEAEILRLWIQDGMLTVGPTPTPVPREPLEPTFRSIYSQVLQPRCVSCHGPTRADRGIRFDTYTNTRREVNLATPEQSDLYRSVRSGDMPMAPDTPLDLADVDVILDWIRAGAPNN